MGGQGLVVTDQTAVEHQPAVGPLGRPAFADWCEAPASRGALHDFEVDAQAGGVLDGVLVVAAVVLALAQGGVVGGGLLEEGAAGRGVLDAGRGD